jgi:putative membrane protein
VVEVTAMMYWNDGSVGWAGWVVMVLSMAAFWGLLAWLAVSLVRSTGTAPRGPSPAPEEVLAERFARGDIDEEDYLQRSEILRRQRPGTR